jgi:hypothetical protein
VCLFFFLFFFLFSLIGQGLLIIGEALPGEV